MGNELAYGSEPHKKSVIVRMVTWELPVQTVKERSSESFLDGLANVLFRICMLSE